MDASFVKLVEDDSVYALESGVVDQHSGEYAFCENFDAGFCRYFVFKAYTVAHRLACWLSYETCHSLGNLSGCKSSWFQHEDFSLAVHPFKDGKREQRRLARSWGCCDYKISRLFQRLIDRVGYAEGRQCACLRVYACEICHAGGLHTG